MMSIRLLYHPTNAKEKADVQWDEKIRSEQLTVGGSRIGEGNKTPLNNAVYPENDIG
jgi:hypothetical protein